ncbi:MAG TPA: proton-conducting transporter membrane subunit [Gemmatimonadaceae bacterium]|nr:proton-conducting transporter membrane subunit [Gemmatimonadaceae bacterium]
MLLLAILLAPAVAAGVAYVIPLRGMRLAILVTTSIIHTTLIGILWTKPSASALRGWLEVDPLGLVVLTLVSILFLAASVYAVGLLREESPRGGRLFVSCLLAFLAATSLVTLSQHFALLWVGMESTTLAVAPLIFHRHDRRSLEAVWKYLVLSSVGIAFALLAVFLLATAQPVLAGVRALVLGDILANAAALEPSWLRAAYVFALVGFGTKMGLAPLHVWKPDTYGEAPSLVGALMSGALTSCAFLGLARFTEVVVAADLIDFARPLLIGFGLVSLVVAAAFIIGQADVKRLLAYSSVEHMGLLVLGLGVGGIGTYGSVLHVLNNGIAKGMLFLVVGNLVLATGSSIATDMGGMLKLRPWSAGLLLFGLFAVTGSPPFGLFVSEFSIVSGAIRQHHWWVAAAILVLLAIIFVGIAAMVLGIVFGKAVPGAADEKVEGEGALMLIGPLGLAALVTMLGLYIPTPLQASLTNAAKLLGGAAP